MRGGFPDHSIYINKKIQAFREKAKCLYACKRVCESQRQEIHITCISFFSTKQLSGLRPTTSAPERLRRHRSHLPSLPHLLLTCHLPASPPSHLLPDHYRLPTAFHPDREPSFHLRLRFRRCQLRLRTLPPLQPSKQPSPSYRSCPQGSRPTA